ncbi:MAG: rod-binding protein [Candidatus Eremiobacteraeota bacterium]|nr:rod-binding protein [Candidatus Eremiobacteraeota bacterium]MBV8369594.1 rod-binding protein [Candidatus Eremiobacteraeota bacterium]
MNPLDRAGAAAQSAPLTADQQKQLGKLHDAAQQMEALFVDMLFKEMRKSSPPTSLTGKVSNAEQTFGEMLDEKRAEELAKTGSLGIGAVLEQQLRSAVLGSTNVAPAAKLPQQEREE